MENVRQPITFILNGSSITVNVERSWTLLYLLREQLGLTGTKFGCGTGDCGACKVLVDGTARNSCTFPALKANGCTITTIEGIQEQGRLSILQQSFIEAGAIQCGFCTPGMIITGTALLRMNPHPTEQQIREAYVNNLCRCTGYVNIVKAVKMAAERMQVIENDHKKLQEAINVR